MTDTPTPEKKVAKGNTVSSIIDHHEDLLPTGNKNLHLRHNITDGSSAPTTVGSSLLLGGGRPLSGHPTRSYVRQQVSSLTESNSKEVLANLDFISGIYGREIQGDILAFLFEKTAPNLVNNKQISNVSNCDPWLQYLKREIVHIAAGELDLATLFSIGAGVISTKNWSDYLSNLVSVLELSPDQAVSLSVGLALSPDKNIAEGSAKVLERSLSKCTGNLPARVVQELQHILKTHEIFLRLNPDRLNSILKRLHLSNKENIVLSSHANLSFLNREPLRMSYSDMSSMTDRISSSTDITKFISDLGHACTHSVGTLKDTLKEANNGLSLDDASLSRLITFFASIGSAKQGDDFSSTLVGSLLPSVENAGEDKNGSHSSWDLDVVCRVLEEEFSQNNWEMVARHFDHPEFFIKDAINFAALLKLYKAGAKRDITSAALLSEWKNTAGQISLLEQLIHVNPNVYSVNVTDEEAIDATIGVGCPNRCFSSVEFLHRLLALSDSQYTRQIRDILIKGLMTCPEVLFCALVRLRSVNVGTKMKSDLLAQLVSMYFKPNRHQHAVALIKRLWIISQQTVVAACTEVWRSVTLSTERMPVMMHITNILRLLPESANKILGSRDFDFCVSVAFVAADKDFIKLNAWLQERISSVGMPFAFTLVAYISKTYAAATPRSDSPLVSIENIATALKILQNAESALLNQPSPGGGATLGENVKVLTEACVQKHPSIITSAPHNDDIEEMADSYLQKIYTSEQSISEVVEMLKKFKTSGNTRDNEIFACMIHNLFDEYRFFAKYPEKELRITGILFGTLIQEQLVSSITLGIALRYVLEALRKPPGPQVGSGKMFRFGMFALEQFKGRLYEWPQYCSHIVQIPHLKQGQPELVQDIERAMAESQRSTNSNDGESNERPEQILGGTSLDAGALHPAPLNSLPLPGASIGVASLLLPIQPKVAVFGVKLGRAVTGVGLDTEHKTPPDNVLDRVQFIINNLSMTNVDQKVGELKDIITAEFFGWLGQYLVVKRISTQPNFHNLYLAFLDKLGDYGKGLVDAILQSVYLGIGKLLRSPKITTSTSERSLLKNLGSWLGSITLARNKPILQKMLDCKELLFQGYETGRLIAVTPFVAKILEGAKASIVFRPPNPWVMGLLSVFKCLYDVDDLKMNIKFEVEVLCKNLNVKLEDIEIRDDLSKRIPPHKEKNPDFNIKSAMANNNSGASSNGPMASPEGKPSAPPSVTQSEPPTSSASTSSNSSSFQEQTVIPNLASYVTINPAISLFNANSSLKRVVPIAVDRAIREIIQPVVERSVTIACITTKELITKDYAMESDENKMRKAAQLMVSNLAGSLALVTCKEPLRASISTHLKQLLTAAIQGDRNSPESEKMMDQVVQSCSNDNLELGCMLIEKAATEKALRDIDEALATAFQTRRKHREQTGQPYYDMSIFGNNRYPTALPEPLRPKPGGLQNSQLLVYDAFQRMPRQPMVSQQTSSEGSSNNLNTSSGSTVNNRGIVSPAVAVGDMLTSSQGLEALSAVVNKLDTAINALLSAAGSRAGSITVSMIPADHEVRKILEGVKVVTSCLSHGNVLDEAVLSFAQGVFKRMYDLSLSEPLRLEVFIALLQCLDEVCPKLSKEIGTWVTYAPMNNDNQKKLNRTILLLLVRSKLVKIADLDVFITRSMADGRNSIWIEFAILFVRTAVLEKIAALDELKNTIEMLNKIGERSGSNYQKPVSRLMDELRSGSNRSNESNNSPSDSNAGQSTSGSLSEATKRAAENIAMTARNDPQQTRQQVTFLLESWIRVYTETPGNEKAYAQYLQLLQQHGVGKSEDQTERFFRVSTELVVEAVLKTGSVDMNGKQKMLHFSVVDAYAKLVTLLIRYMNGGGAQEQVAAQRIALLNKVLGITVRTLMANYERSKGRTHWDQRPWFRLLLNLVFDLNAPSPALDPISLGILSVFGSAFHVVQPSVIPGFASAWLELISHRMFLPNLLLAKGQKGWAIAHQLLIDLFLFMEPYLRKAELSDAIKALYKGTLRVLLLLIHDFPSFLADYHLSFCNVIPENCVHLRNIILSAIPRGMTFPDPFTPNLKIDLLPEIQQNPRILSNVAGPLASIRGDLDNYLNNRQPSNFVQELLPKLYKDGKNEIDTPRVHSLVLYVGMQAISRLQNSQIAHTPEIEVLQKLMEFDEKGRYISLNAIANNLRYPSSHTHYFSCVMLFLFSEAKDDGVKEQVTRVLLERLIVNRPHPVSLYAFFSIHPLYLGSSL